MSAPQPPLEIDGVTVAPGERANVKLRMARLYTHAELDLPVHVVHGRRPGPCLFVSAAIHGDEINGVEIIRRLLQRKAMRRLRGTLLAVPIVNVYGFVHQSRYLPDRRDLNRSFPGIETGSLASRVADLFMKKIVARSTHGIDLHTGSNHRTNLPQIRACMSHPETARLAHAFRAPVILDANLRDGSLRQAGVEREMPMLLYEAGEALRYNEQAIRVGVRGIAAVMRAIGMLPASRRAADSPPSLVATSSAWVRAPGSGVLHGAVRLGTAVGDGDLLGTITDPFGQEETEVRSPAAGLVIGRLKLPLVYQGDALMHLARLDGTAPADLAVRQELSPEEWTRWW